MKNKFFNSAMRLSILNKDLMYRFELTGKEKQRVNYILYQTGSTISRLISLPMSMLKHIKFSNLISQQLSNVYRSHVPQILNKALTRARVNHRMAWNFILAITTGKNYQERVFDFLYSFYLYSFIHNYTLLLLKQHI